MARCNSASSTILRSLLLHGQKDSSTENVPSGRCCIALLKIVPFSLPTLRGTISSFRFPQKIVKKTCRRSKLPSCWAFYPGFFAAVLHGSLQVPRHNEVAVEFP